MSEMDKKIYGSFYLSDSEFALAVSFVQEVVNAPLTYTAVPLAPPYLKGLFNLRGVIIPVLDLRGLFHLPESAISDGQKIAIVELEDCSVGLVFDKTGEVFRSSDEERSDFNSSGPNDVVSGVFKKDEGKRIVQILDVTKIFKIQHVPKDANRNSLRQKNLGKKRGSRNQCISFVVGPAKCSLPISDIQEILKIEKLSESSLGTGYCIGTIDLRGTTVPVIDFTALLGYREVDRSAAATQGERRIVVMKLDKEYFGLMVDAVDSIISYFPDDLLAFPLVEQGRSEMLVGCITGYGDSDILLLDHKKILNHSEISEITRGHSKLYQSQVQRADEQKSKGGARKTYITFQIEGTFAVAINEVKEIIDFPSHLLQPPGLQKHMRGVLNLRGDLVTIIDPRGMYAMKGENKSEILSKVLVFKRGNTHFGLMVDSVESIITFAENDKMTLPEILHHQGEGSLSSDISEAVEVVDANGVRQSMLILCVESVAARALKASAA